MKIQLKHDSRDEFYRSPFGAVEKGEKIYISLLSNKSLKVYLELTYFDYSIESKKMNIKRHGECEYLYYCHVDPGKNYEGIINYYFKVIIDGKFYAYYGNRYDFTGGEGQIYQNLEPVPYQITIYKAFKVPKWFKEGIVYQIFVDRFKNGSEDGTLKNTKPNGFIYGNWGDEPMYIRDKFGNIDRWDFFGGNLKGIIKKLDYMKSLGVTAIYLNPIFESVSNHKYDTGDYKKIDNMYGDENIFEELCKKAEGTGIKIILDGVFSHTGEDSIYFNKYGNYNSLGAYESKKSPYYSWYHFNEYPEKYNCWWNIKSMPEVNELEYSYEKFIVSGKDSVLEKWMKFGVSGWRLDVADELPDEFIEKIRNKIKQINSESVLIGEVWEDASNKTSYSKRRKYVFGHELDSATGYPFRNSLIGFLKGDIDSELFERKIMSLLENYPKEFFYSNLNILSTHDTERIFTILSGNRKLLKIAVGIQMTMPGVPLIYYGDEAGMTGGKDPLNRKTYPWGKEDLDILEFYRNITNLRSGSECLRMGDIKFYRFFEDVLCYERNFKNQKIIVAVNRNNIRSFNIKVKNMNIILPPYGIKLII